MASKRLPAKERRKQILRAAIRVFARNGFAGATTREIAEEADVAEALLYRYFNGKKSLFVEAMRLTAQRLLEEMERVSREFEDQPTDALMQLLLFYRNAVEKHEDFAKMVFVISAELDDDEIREVYMPFQERTLDLLETTIRQWQKRGLVKDSVPPRAAAWVVVGCFHTIALMKHTGKLEELHLKPALQLVRAIVLQDSADTDNDRRLP